MRILVIGQFCEEAFAAFVADAFEALGHEVARHDPMPRLVPNASRFHVVFNMALRTGHDLSEAGRRFLWPGEASRRLRRAAERAGPVDLVLTTYDFLLPADARLVKKITGAPLALWYPDPIWSFRRHMFLNAPYDLLFFKDPYLVHVLRATLGAPVHYLPECYSPASLAPGPEGDAADPAYEADIAVAGNLYAYRVALFARLAHRDVRIWGPPAPRWMDLGPLAAKVQNKYVANAEKRAALRGAKIVLNALNPAEIWGTAVRTFEAAGAGAFQITDWRPGLEGLFDVGREIVTFDDFEELERKIEHYLAAPEERRAIAEAGQRRAERDHTYEVRVGQLLDTVAGRAAGYPEPHAAPTPRMRAA